MKKFVELPLIEPLYSTYHHGILSAALKNNPTIRNWYLNEMLILRCDRKFLSGYTTPLLNIDGLSLNDHPYVERLYFPLVHINGCVNRIIRNMLNLEYYILFSGVDDYYVGGKSWYKERHFSHDGAICGYDQVNKTYCMYAYDSNWIYQKFWTPQKGFEAGRKACFRKGDYGWLCAIKPKPDNVEFSVKTVYEKILEYLDSDLEKYPAQGEGNVYGIVVHHYIALYVDKLYDGSIAYEKMDTRIFRLIWEHKKVMLERIKMVERTLCLDSSFSEKYSALVAEADTLRMLYASHHMKRRDSVLPIIRKKLLALMDAERVLLTALTNAMKEEMKL